MTPSDPSSDPDVPAGRGDFTPTPPPRRGGGYGVLSWALFVIAIAAVLVLLGGCLSALYAPLFNGG